MILLKIVRNIFPPCTSAINSHSRPSAQVEKTAGQLHLKHIDILTNLKEIRGLQAFRKIVNYTCAIRLERGVCGRALTPQTLDLKVRGSSLASRVVSQDKELYSTLSLFTQMYKRVPATYCWGVTLRWTSIPSRGEKQYS